MSPVFVNGRQLGVAQNGVFTDANTDPIPGGKLWPQAAASWTAMRAAYIAAGGNPADFMPAGPVSSARPVAAQQFFYGHRPPAAAIPGTSNHGWGIAVDVKTRHASAWIMVHGHEFGWSHDEGERVGEWWHFRLVALVKLPKRDRLAHLTSQERRWCHEFDRLRRENRNVGRQRVLVRVMTKQRKRIWKAAQQSGWDRANRAARYRSLLSRTT